MPHSLTRLQRADAKNQAFNFCPREVEHMAIMWSQDMRWESHLGDDLMTASVSQKSSAVARSSLRSLGLEWPRNSCPKTALRCTNQYRIMVSVEDTSPQSRSPRTQIGQLSGSGICMAREILVCIDVAFVLGIRNSAHLYLGLRYIHTSVRCGWLVGQVRLQLGYL